MTLTNAQANRKQFWWMIFGVLLLCSVPMFLAMVPQENRVAWRLQSEGCYFKYGSVDGGLWTLHPVYIACERAALTNEILEQFPKMPHLDAVYFDDVKFDGLDLSPLTKLSKLDTLIFSNCRNLSSENLQKLEDCPKLWFLVFGEVPITRKEIQALKKCSLSDLHLTSANLTNDELEEIATFSSLSEIGIVANPGITDEGLEHLLKMKRLGKVDLSGTSVTREGIEDFRKRHPNAKLIILSDF